MVSLCKFLFSFGPVLSSEADETNSPWSPLKADRRFGRFCRLHLQDSGANQARNQREVGSKQCISPKRQLTFNELHGVSSQNTEIFITTAVRISNST
jgi:hypothetical protein